MTTTTMDAEKARAFRDGYEQQVKALSRTSRRQLEIIDRTELRAHGITRIMGSLSKDELIRDILDLRGFSKDLLNESTHWLYHKPGEPWSACEFCEVAP